MICHHCRNEVKVEGFISRTDDCPHCGSDIRCCLNCDSYDPGAHNRCREPQAEWVTDREKANFCDYFKPNKRKTAGTKTATIDARSDFENLFKK
jgi:hypothetical protein